MGDSNSKISEEDLEQKNYKVVDKILIPNCGSLPLLEFEKDNTKHYVLKVYDQKKWEGHDYDKKKLQQRFNDKIANVSEVALVHHSKTSDTKFQMVFVHACDSLEKRLKKSD